MEEKPILKIGDRVEQMCLTCGEERGHIIASMTKTGKITRVSCPKCGSRVAEFAKVVAHRCEAQRFGYPGTVFEKSFGKEAPEFLTLTIDNSQPDKYSRERCQAIHYIVVIGFGELLRRSPH